MFTTILLTLMQAQVRDPFPDLKVEAVRALEFLAHQRDYEDGMMLDGGRGGGRGLFVVACCMLQMLSISVQLPVYNVRMDDQGCVSMPWLWCALLCLPFAIVMRK